MTNSSNNANSKSKTDTALTGPLGAGAGEEISVNSTVELIPHPGLNTPEKPLFQPTDDETYIPESLTAQEYAKLGLKAPDFDDDFHRSTFVRLSKGKYSRKVTALYIIRTAEDTLKLNWHETREGRSGMGKKLDPRVIDNMGIKKIPVPKEEIVANLESEEYETIVTATNETIQDYFFDWSKKAVSELLRDSDKFKAKHYIKIDDKDPIVISRDEFVSITNVAEFDKLYKEKKAYIVRQAVRNF